MLNWQYHCNKAQILALFFGRPVYIQKIITKMKKKVQNMK
jgi:hypothetical protein